MLGGGASARPRGNRRPLIARIAGAVELLRVGPAEDFATEVPALIDPDAVAKYHRYAELCRGAEVAKATAPADGQYVEPLLVTLTACRPTRRCFARRSSVPC